MGFFNKEEENKLKIPSEITEADLLKMKALIISSIISNPNYEYDKKDLKSFEIPSQSVTSLGIQYQDGYKYKLAALEADRYIREIL